MTTQDTSRLATDKLKAWLEEMYNVSAEIAIVQAMWAEMSCGPRNANDVFALDALNTRLRAIRKERAALHKLIHEEPERNT